MAKDPARVAAGKKAWRNLSASKKAQVIARLRPFRKGGGGGKMARRSGGGSPVKSSGSNPGTKRMGMGATYDAFMTGAQIVAPLTEETLLRLKDKRSLTDGLGDRLQKKVMTTAYAANLGVTAIDGYINTKMRQNQALSRGSVTAVLPELYLGAIGLDEFRTKGGSVENRMLETNRRVLRARQGYAVYDDTSKFGDPEFVRYRTLKHGLQAGRYVANRTRIGQRLVKPFRPLLRALGATV